MGTVLPTAGQNAEIGRAMRTVLETDLAALNRGGGLNGRKLRLVVGGYDGSRGPEAAIAAARRLVTGGRVLALVSGFFPAAEQQVFDLAEKEHLPIVGPLTLYASQAGPANPWVFHLLGGVREQARVLVDFAAERLFLAYPTVPGDGRPEARERLAAMDLPAGRHGMAAPINADAAVT
ncbi:MAG TPA: ABC transporter substrate-binding protein, partial [Anaeromyxobacter sp.]